MKLLVPMYGYPTVAPALWSGVAEAGSSGVAIINPASGPTATPNADYVRACDGLGAAGVRMIGYTDAAYGQKTASQVLAEIGTWRTGWGTWLSGVFVDRAVANVSFLSSLKQATQSYGWTLVVNPGAVWPANVLTYCDAAVIFENSRAMWYPQAMPAHVAGHAAIVHSAPQLGSVVDDAQRLGLSMIYVTNDSGPNPYDTLPSYWADLLAAVRPVEPPLANEMVEARLTRIESAIAALVASWQADG